MGIKTLSELEGFFKANKKSSFNRTELRQQLKINWYTLGEALDYLRHKGIIVEKKNRYRWGGKK